METGDFTEATFFSDLICKEHAKAYGTLDRFAFFISSLCQSVTLETQVRYFHLIARGNKEEIRVGGKS